MNQNEFGALDLELSDLELILPRTDGDKMLPEVSQARCIIARAQWIASELFYEYTVGQRILDIRNQEKIASLTSELVGTVREIISHLTSYPYLGHDMSKSNLQALIGE